MTIYTIKSCEICNNTFKSFRNRRSCSIECKRQIQSNSHKARRNNKETPQEKYDRVYNMSGFGICLYCGNHTNFRGSTRGYAKYCSLSCGSLSRKMNDSTKEKISNAVVQLWKQRRVNGTYNDICQKMSDNYNYKAERPMPRSNFRNGKFKPKNPKKYKGDITNIIFRSSWELIMMKYLDENSNVIYWSSEEISIPYKSLIDGRYHRYFPDFVVEIRTSDGKIKTMVLEIKPKAQTKEPTKKTKKTKKYLSEVLEWSKNSQKWKAASEYCLDRLWEFKLITEQDLGLA